MPTTEPQGRFEWYERNVSPFSYESRECGFAYVEDDADRERLKFVMNWRFPVHEMKTRTANAR